jgi:hypothetical protein
MSVTETYILPQPAAQAGGFALGTIVTKCPISQVVSLTVNGKSQPTYLGTSGYNFGSAWWYFPLNMQLIGPNPANNVPAFTTPPVTSPPVKAGDVIVVTYIPSGNCPQASTAPSVAQSPTAQPVAVTAPPATPVPAAGVSIPTRVQERAQWYVARVPNPGSIAGLTQNGLSIQLDTDAPFRLHSIGVYCFSSTGVALGASGNIGVTLRFYRPDGTQGVQKHILSAQALNPYDAAAVNGAGGQTAPYFSLPTPVQPNILYPAGGVITFDYAALAGVTDALVMVVFMGTKLGFPGQFWNGAYPAKFRARPFFGYTIQISTANLPLYDQPLQIQRDADFVIQTAVQTSYPAVLLSPVGGMRGLGIRMKDWNEKYYMNDFVPVELVFGGFDFSQIPAVIYPEIYVPKTQMLLFDLVQL